MFKSFLWAGGGGGEVYVEGGGIETAYSSVFLRLLIRADFLSIQCLLQAVDADAEISRRTHLEMVHEVYLHANKTVMLKII